MRRIFYTISTLPENDMDVIFKLRNSEEELAGTFKKDINKFISRGKEYHSIIEVEMWVPK